MSLLTSFCETCCPFSEAEGLTVRNESDGYLHAFKLHFAKQYTGVVCCAVLWLVPLPSMTQIRAAYHNLPGMPVNCRASCSGLYTPGSWPQTLTVRAAGLGGGQQLVQAEHVSPYQVVYLQHTCDTYLSSDFLLASSKSCIYMCLHRPVILKQGYIGLASYNQTAVSCIPSTLVWQSFPIALYSFADTCTGQGEEKVGSALGEWHCRHHSWPQKSKPQCQVCHLQWGQAHGAT